MFPSEPLLGATQTTRIYGYTTWAEARVELESRSWGKEEELKLEKEQIENGVRNSTGAGRESIRPTMERLGLDMATVEIRGDGLQSGKRCEPLN
jgi:hypothetical protein